MASTHRQSRKRSAGIGPDLERDLDAKAIFDVLRLYNETPSVKNARASVYASSLSEPFTFSIPALKLTSETYGNRIIEVHWMPWLKQVYDWCQTIGICPYYMVTRGRHRVPVTPDFEMGHITVSVTEDHRVEFHWYWSHASVATTSMEADPKMRWVRTPNLPSINGQLRSPLASHLENYRSLLIMRTAQNIVNTQRPRPTHIIEQRLSGATAPNDDLQFLSADFGKAAGISQKRRDESAELQMRQRQRQLYLAMEQQQKKNLAATRVTPTLWTDTPQELLEEADAGFANRVIVLRPQLAYREAAKPDMVADYGKAEMRFDTMVSATMDRALEVLTPTGAARSQNIEGAARFENERNKALTAFFTTVVRNALLEAYGPELAALMEAARTYRVKNLGSAGDPSQIAFLYPNLDLVVDMSSSSVVSNTELRLMRNDGIITQEYMGQRIAMNNNMPADEMVALPWPDGVAADIQLPGGPVPAKPAAAASKKSKH